MALYKADFHASSLVCDTPLKSLRHTCFFPSPPPYLPHVVQLPDYVLEVGLAGQRVNVGMHHLLKLLPRQDGEGLALVALTPNWQDGQDRLTEDRQRRLMLGNKDKTRT